MMRLTSILIAVTSLVAPAFSLVHGVDSSILVSEATFKKAKGESFTKAIIRGYEEACSEGGRVDPNFVQAYKNARAAGITNIDTYMFFCTGANNKCKSPAQQISEISETFNKNKMDIGKIWIDIEVDSVCDNWNYGASGNQAHAKSIVSAMKDSGLKFGIYSSPGEWADVFGSESFNLDSSAPLWFATYNDVESLSMGTKFGGWSSAVGHQYTDKSASGDFDLNVFSS